MFSRLIHFAQIALLLVCPLTCNGALQAGATTTGFVGVGSCCAHCGHAAASEMPPVNEQSSAPLGNDPREESCQCICGGAVLTDGTPHETQGNLGWDALTILPALNAKLTTSTDPARLPDDLTEPPLAGRALCCALMIWRC